MALSLTPYQIVENFNFPLLTKKLEWKRVKLNEISNILNGCAFQSDLFNHEGIGMPVFRIRDVGNNYVQSYYSGEWDERYVVYPGDIIIGMDGDFNCDKWKGPKALLNQRVCKIEPNTNYLNSDWLSLILPGYLQAINSVTSSVTVKHLSSKTVMEVPIPLPTLAEQNQIVAKIEELFSELD